MKDTKILRLFNSEGHFIACQTVSANITKEQIAKKIKFLFGNNRFFVGYKLYNK